MSGPDGVSGRLTVAPASRIVDGDRGYSGSGAWRRKGGIAVAEGKKDRVVCSRSHGLEGSIWLIGWLFTIGYVKLSFWPGVLAIIIWPWYLGSHLR
jgi:hypothetical protein